VRTLCRCAPARELERQVAAVAADEPDRERDHHRLLAGLAGRRRDGLGDVHAVGFGARIVAAGDDDLGRAGLRIPEHELAEVDARNVGEALHELFDGRGLAVVTVEVEVHAFSEVVRAEQRLEHAHDLGALLVDGRGVKLLISW
jgi:hypothetical protein